MVRRASWRPKLETVDWRVDVNVASKHSNDQLSEPNALVAFTFDNAETTSLHMTSSEVSSFLDTLELINSALSRV